MGHKKVGRTLDPGREEEDMVVQPLTKVEEGHRLALGGLVGDIEAAGLEVAEKLRVGILLGDVFHHDQQPIAAGADCLSSCSQQQEQA